MKADSISLVYLCVFCMYCMCGNWLQCWLVQWPLISLWNIRFRPLSSPVFFSFFIHQDNNCYPDVRFWLLHWITVEIPIASALCIQHWLKCIISVLRFDQISEYFWLLSGNPLCSSGTLLKKAKALWYSIIQIYIPWFFFCWLCTHQQCCEALCVTVE